MFVRAIAFFSTALYRSLHCSCFISPVAFVVAAMCELKNTVRFTFSNGADKPAIGEVANFVKCLDAELDEIEAAYRIAEEKSLFVKFKSERSMLHALTANSDELIFHYGNGKKVKVHMSHAQDHICYVRIYDLPPEVPDQEIVTVLSKYGCVKRVVREKFPAELGIPAYTGVRGAYMDVKQEIPSSLHFTSRKGNIYYQGNKDKCFICKEEGHLMASCPKRKARSQPKERRQEKEQSGRLKETYGCAVTGGIATVGSEAEGEVELKTPEVLEEEIEEAAMMPVDTEISDDETNEMDARDRALIKFAAFMSTEISKQKESARIAKEQEEAKVKSPPRKKKNLRLLKK